jgi:hypothetical protein
MLLTIQQGYELLANYGCFAREICDKCGALLGAVRFTRRDEAGAWCSRECRGDGERQVIRKGGRPREYESSAQRQRAYRERRGCYETPSKIARNKGLADTKNGSLVLPLIRPDSAQETACSESGGARV